MSFDPTPLRRVRTALDRAGYTVAGVRALLGPVAGAALAREEIVPALRATRGSAPLELLVRLFWLQVPVPDQDALPVADLLAAGLAERSGGELRALLRVEPVGDGGAGYAVSDRRARPGDTPPRPDHVVGQGGASESLARLVVRRPVGEALDLGTGCGVQAVHLAGRAGRITATDLNPRALELARMTFALSGIEAELLEGSLFEPVRGRAFDLIVSNPPFVISPEARFTYREAGLDGDELCRRLVRAAPRYLAPGGWCHLLANWLHVDGEDWRERVAGWVGGVEAWIVQRDVLDPAEYAELWLRDSCEVGTPEYARRYAAWLEYFERRRATGVGLGWITLRATEPTHGSVRVEELRHAVDQPVGAYVAEVFRARAAGRVAPDTVLRAAAGLVQEQLGPPGAEHPERIVLRQSSGLRRAAEVGTVPAALAGACDGDLPLEPLLAAIAELTGEDPATVRSRALAVLPGLVADGFFDVVRSVDV